MTKEMLAHSRATTLLAASATGVVAIALLAGASTASAGTWTSSGDDVYYTGGNVGIGTSTPWAPLAIQASSTDMFTFCHANPNGDCLGGTYVESDGTGSFYVGDGLGTGGVGLRSNGDSYFDGGNVGIGTLPDSGVELHVDGGTAATQLLEGSALARIQLYDSGANRKMGWLVDGNMHLYDWTAGAYRMTINTSGNVGISDTSPAYKLEVAGDVNTTAGGYRDGGSCVAGTCASDRNLKHNIASINDGLAKVLQINPVSFEFTDAHYGAGTQYGVIAQEIETVFPELVEDTDEGYKKVSYGLQLQMYALAAIKDVWNMVTGHDARIAHNEQRAAELRAEIAELKQLLSEQK